MLKYKKRRRNSEKFGNLWFSQWIDWLVSVYIGFVYTLTVTFFIVIARIKAQKEIKKKKKIVK